MGNPWSCSACRNRSLVSHGLYELGPSAVCSTTVARTDVCSASSCLYAGPGGGRINPHGSNRASFVRIRGRARDRRAPVVIGCTVCPLRRSGVLVDGNSLYYRTAV